MLSKISVEQLRANMYIAEIIECPGVRMPKRKSGMIRDPRIIELLKDIGVKELIIDTDKGDDVEPPPDQDLPTLVNDHDVDLSDTQHSSLARELTRAQTIFDSACALINQSTEALREGQGISLRDFDKACTEIYSSLMRNADALIWCGKLREEKQYLSQHSVNCALLMGIFGERVGMKPSYVRNAILGALVHSLGLSSVDPNVFYKNGPLTRDEYKQIQEHVEILSGFSWFKDLPPITQKICLEQHERCDGSGFPNGLIKDDISFFGRMFAIVDAYDALTTNKTYKQGMASSIGIKDLLIQSFTVFDEALVFQFLKALGEHPTGSLVMLNNANLGVVLEQNGQFADGPVVKVFYDTVRDQYIDEETLDLSEPGITNNIVGQEDPSQFSIDVLEFMPEPE